MNAKWIMVVLVAFALVVPARAQFFSGSRGGGSYGYGNGGQECDPTPFGIATIKQKNTEREIANRMLDMEQARGEVHYSQLAGTQLGQSIVSIKLAQQAAEAQKAAETKAEEAAKKVSELSVEVGELKALCQQLLAENQQLKALLGRKDQEIAALKAEVVRLKVPPTTSPKAKPSP